MMQELVGIVRREDEIRRALDSLTTLRERARKVSVTGNREYNPGWHTALDLQNLLTVSEIVARAALERKESRGGHFRDDLPEKDPAYARFNILVRLGINGMPRLMCMTRLSELDLHKPVTVEPMRAFPLLKDLVTDVSSNFRAKKRIRRFTPRPPDAPDGTWRMAQADADRVQEFRKCIECFLCQDVCHVLRDHQLHEQFVGPRLLVHAAQLEMHPLDVLDRTQELKDNHGIGYCNITKCCTKVCPENITITDNAIIPLTERVVDRHYDH